MEAVRTLPLPGKRLLTPVLRAAASAKRGREDPPPIHRPRSRRLSGTWGDSGTHPGDVTGVDPPPTGLWDVGFIAASHCALSAGIKFDSEVRPISWSVVMSGL